MMKRARFEGKVLVGHKGAAVEVPFDPAKRWGMPARSLRPGRRGHHVSGHVGAHSFESAIVPRARRFYLLLSSAFCRKAGIAIGDSIRVVVAPSPSPAL